jgi:hypothetical protein
MNKRWLLVGVNIFLLMLVVSIWWWQDQQSNYPITGNQAVALPYPPSDNEVVSLSELLESEVEIGDYNIEGYVTQVYYCNCPIGVLCDCPIDSISISDNCVDEALLNVDDPRRFIQGGNYLFSIGVYDEPVVDTVVNKVKSYPVGGYEVEVLGYKMRHLPLDYSGISTLQSIEQSSIQPGDYTIQGYVIDTYDCGECPVGARFCSSCDRIVISDNCVDDLSIVVDDSRPFEKGVRYDVSLKILPYEGKLSSDDIKVVGYNKVR